MAVPEQTPYLEYEGNGVSKVFPLTFDCNDSEHLVVKVDDETLVVGAWSLVGNDVVFALPPAVDSKITLQRNTPLERETNYKTFDNSFRPAAINKEFDRIWWKLQELLVQITLLWLTVNSNIGGIWKTLNREIQDRINGDLSIRAWVTVLLNNIVDNGLVSAIAVTTVESVSDLQHLIKWDGRTVFVKSYHNGKGLGGGYFVFSFAQSGNYDGGVTFNGWVRQYDTLLIEHFGALGSTDNSLAFSSAFNYMKGKTGKLVSNLDNHLVSQECIFHDNLNLDLRGGTIEFTGAGKFAGAIYNKDRTSFVAAGVAEIYYKYQRSTEAQNPMSRITVDALKKSSSIIVQNADDFEVGDYIFISNGYCDMWRVMEKYGTEGLPPSRSYQDWVRPDVDLWRCEIARIKFIVENTIYLEDEISHDYLTNVKTYGFFSNENNRDDHQGWNFARIERLGGASNCTIQNMKAINNGAEISIVSYLGVNNRVLDSFFEGDGQGVDFITCYNSHISRSYSDTFSFGQSIRRGSQMCTMDSASAKYVSGDCPLIIWEGANLCIANNINVEGTGGNLNHAKMGFYFNTCWNCVGANFVGKNLEVVVGTLFCRGNITLNNLNGINCGVLFSCYSAFDVKADLGVMSGRYVDSTDDYDAALFLISESNNIDISNLKEVEKYSNTQSGGRIHIFKSFGIKMTDIDAENLILWNSVDDDKVYDSSKFKMKLIDCNFKKLYLTQSYVAGEAQTRRTYLRNSDIMQNIDISNTHNTELRNTNIKGLNVSASLILNASHYTRLIHCEIRNISAGIDFRGGGAVGSENWTSLVYIENTFVDAPTKFLNYADPSYSASINTLSPKSRAFKYLTVLTDYPKIKTLVNPLGDGNTSGWYQVQNTKDLVIESVTTVTLQTASNPINAIANKWLGREVYNTSISKFMKATGSASTSTWVSTDGASTITPA